MSDGSDPALSDPDGPVPRIPRQSVFLKATLRTFGSDEQTEHRVRDLSAGGVRIDRAEGLGKGATVLVSVGMLEAVGATVVWIADGWAGLKFATLIDPDAARGKVAIRPQGDRPSFRTAASAPIAGWMNDLDNAYRK